MHDTPVGLWLTLAAVAIAATPTRPRAAEGGAVTFTGSIHGPIPPATCTDAGTRGVPLRSFGEITVNGSARRVFQIQLHSSCAAPLYQALFSRERVEARVSVPNGADELRSTLVDLADARLTRVELSTAANERGVRYPLITVELTVSRVTGAAPPRERRSQLYSDVSLVPRGLSESWVHDGFAGTSVRLASKLPGHDVTFASGDQRIAAAWSVDERTGMPRDDLHISIDPLDKAAGLDDATLASAVDDRRGLSEAVISFLGRDGAAGIVVWLKRASIAGFHAAAGTTAGARGVSRVSLVTRQITITDIGSGRTAAYP